MKEAAGEANMTVITIVLIGVVAAAGAVFIPRLLQNVRARSCCMNELSGVVKDGICEFVDPRYNQKTTRTLREIWDWWKETCGFND